MRNALSVNEECTTALDTSDSASLIARIAKRDETALAALFDTYHRLVYTEAFRLCRSAPAAETVTHRVFIRVWNVPGDFQGGSPAAWLTRLTRTIFSQP